MANIGKLQGYVELGAQSVSVAGFSSTTTVQKSYPAATVTVYLAGTVTIATIYSDAALTAKANPFTADANAFWFFWADEGSYDVKFSGTGIVTPWTESYMAIAAGVSLPFINVKDKPYNATGNGTTDDTAAFTAATATGRQVYVPLGTYKITSQLSPASNTKLIGEGFGSNLVLAVSDIGIGGAGSNVTIQNLRISGASGRAIGFTNTSGIKILGNWISGATTVVANVASGIQLRTVNDSLVEGNVLSGNGIGSSATDTGLDIYVVGASSRNVIRGNWCTSTTATMNIGLSTDGAGQTCEHNQIGPNNYVSGAITKSDLSIWGYGIMVYTSGTGPQYTTVIGNHVRNVNGTGIYGNAARTSIIGNDVVNSCITATGGGLALGAIVINSNSPDSKANDNYIKTCPGIALYLGGADSQAEGNTIEATSAYGIYGISSLGLVISGNTITGLIGAGAYGIFASGSNGVVIANNVIRSNQSHGIILTNLATYSIRGNNIQNNGALFDGINISGSCTDGIVSGNISKGQNWGIVNGGVRTRLTENIVSGNTQVAGISDGSFTYRHGNQVSAAGLMRGSAILGAGGTVTVNSTEILAGDVVTLTNIGPGGTQGVLSLGTIVAATSFVINSSNAADTSTVAWEIIH